MSAVLQRIASLANGLGKAELHILSSNSQPRPKRRPCYKLPRVAVNWR
jgi:hypothetical protein